MRTNLKVEHKARILNDAMIHKIELPTLTIAQQEAIESSIDELNERIPGYPQTIKYQAV